MTQHLIITNRATGDTLSYPGLTRAQVNHVITCLATEQPLTITVYDEGPPDVYDWHITRQGKTS